MSSDNIIKLTESDVPGAKLIYSTVAEHACVQLKRWLKCRGLAITGNKPQLMSR